MDYDISHYSDAELLEICGFDDDHDVSEDMLKDVVTDNIRHYHNSNPELASFFGGIKERFTSRIEPGQDSDDTFEKKQSKINTEITGEGRIVTEKDIEDQLHGEKYTLPSGETLEKQDLLNVKTTTNVPYKEGILNPTLKTTTKRLLNVDSKFRPFPGGLHVSYPDIGCSTNYSINLSETIKNVQALTLYSYEIPTSWNTIDEYYCNNKLIILPFVDWLLSGVPAQPITAQPIVIPGIYYVVTVPDGSPNLGKINECLSDSGNWDTYSYFNNKYLGLAKDVRMPDGRFHVGVTTDGHVEIACSCIPSHPDCSGSTVDPSCCVPCDASAAAVSDSSCCRICSNYVEGCTSDASGNDLSGCYITSVTHNDGTIVDVSCNVECLGYYCEITDYLFCCCDDLSGVEWSVSDISAITLSGCDASGTYDVSNGKIEGCLPYSSGISVANEGKCLPHCGYTILLWDTAASTSHAPTGSTPDYDMYPSAPLLALAGMAYPTYLPSFRSTTAAHVKTANAGEMNSSRYQNSLGWLLGFRDATIPFGLVAGLSTESFCTDFSAIAPAWSVWAPSTFRTPMERITPCPPSPCSPLYSWILHDDIPYIYIIIKDYNKNVSSKTVINALPIQTVVDMPDYAKSVTGTIPTGLAQSYSAITAGFPISNDPNNPIRGVITEGSGTNTRATGIYDVADGLTQKQRYTIAAITAARQTRSNYSVSNATNTNDILARITTKQNNGNLNTQNDKWLSGYGGNLSVSSRIYFGPVDITRLTVQLMDPYGNILNLHNRDWSITLQVEQLYQF